MRQVAQTRSIPAPIGGLNDRDSLQDMPEQDAVILENWWVQPSKAVIRKGQIPWSTGYASPVETVLEYNPPSGVNRLFGASGANIYDATAQGAIGAAVVTGLTNARWQDTAITTAGGSFLVICNGADAVRNYDGATWTTPAITGVTSSTLVQVELFKNRLFFTQINSMNAWYLPVNSIAGAASAIPLGSIFRMGGNLVGCYSWTVDAGNGADDRMAFISSNGEVAVYEGTDPATAATWSLIGVFRIGRPIGRRCAIKYGGDLLIICEEGVYPLSKALSSSTINRSSAVTDKIQNAISNAVVSYKNSFGWQLTLFSEQNMLLLNIPGAPQYQYAQNTITGAWTMFTGWSASCWRYAQSGLYYGTSNCIFKAWQTSIDQSSTGANNFITADGLPAFSNFRRPAFNKYYTMVRPYLGTDGVPSGLFGLNLDYVPQNPTGSLSFSTSPGGMVWGAMVWGSMVWGGSIIPIARWQTVGGIAAAASMRLKIQNNYANVEWYATDYLYQNGSNVF